MCIVFSIGCHTSSHPLLVFCHPELNAFKEFVKSSRGWLSPILESDVFFFNCDHAICKMKTKPCVDSREPRDGAFVPKRNYSDKEPAFWNRNWYQNLYRQMQMVLIASCRTKEGLMNFTQIRAHLIHQRQSSSSSMDPHCLLESDIGKTLLKNKEIVSVFKKWISKY